MIIQELLAFEVKFQKASLRARQRERAMVMQELKALAEKRGFTLAVSGYLRFSCFACGMRRDLDGIAERYLN